MEAKNWNCSSKPRITLFFENMAVRTVEKLKVPSEYAAYAVIELPNLNDLQVVL